MYLKFVSTIKTTGKGKISKNNSELSKQLTQIR